MTNDCDYGDEGKLARSPLESLVTPGPSDTRGVGAKHDQGKLRWSLLPWGALKQVVAVMEFGAKKYAEDSWSTVPNGRKRYLDAAFRHLIDAQSETNDPETGLPHLAHCACDVLFALALTAGENK